MTPATAASAAIPGLALRRAILIPCATRARFNPASGNDIAHRAERHQVEPAHQVGFGAVPGIPAHLAQRAVDRDDEQKGDADRRQAAMRALLVEPIRVDDRRRARQQRFGDVMIDDDDLEPGFGRFGERQMRICPAIDRHDDPHSFLAQAQQGRRVRAVALAQAVRHIDPGSAADAAKNRISNAAEVAPSTS